MFKPYFIEIVSGIALSIFALTSCTYNFESAPNFEDGQFEIASNKLIFLELIIDVMCQCECPVIEQPVDSYILSSKVLRIRVFNNLLFDELLDTKSLLINTKVLVGTKGLFANQLYLTDLKAFETLPFKIEQDEHQFLIHAVFNDGTVVVETSKGLEQLTIGKTWESSPILDTTNPDNVCYDEYIYRLTNQRLLEKSNIEFGETYETSILNKHSIHDF